MVSSACIIPSTLRVYFPRYKMALVAGTVLYKGFRVQGLGFRVSGFLGFRVSGSQGLGFRV